MLVRLWFSGTAHNHKPRVIAHGEGDSIEQAMIACFAPVTNKAWKRKYEEGKLTLTHGNTVYCGEVVKPTRLPSTEFYLEKRQDGWWIVAESYDDCGPYASRGEAIVDQQGLQNTIDILSTMPAAREKLPRLRLTVEPGLKPRQRLELPKPRLRLEIPKPRVRL